MANSPSITLNERDASSYAVTTSETILAIVGFASKGKIGEVTRVTSRNDFLEKFGTPPTSSPYSSLAAYRAFNQTNQVLFYRVADVAVGDSEAALAAERVLAGDTAGDTCKIRILMDEKGSALNGSYIIVSTIVNPVLGDSTIDIKFYYKTDLKETFTGLSRFAGDTNFFETKINATSDNGGSNWFSVEVAFLGAAGDSIAWLNPGRYYIGQAAITGDAGIGDTSPWATGDTWSAANGDSIDYDFRAGTDGIPAAGGDTLIATALATSGALANTELWNYHILITPDTSVAQAEDAGVTLAEFRGDCIYIADPPYSKTYEEAADWHNGDTVRTVAFNSSYAATFWPWLKDYNPISGEYVWCPPSVFVAEKMLEVDRKWGPWYAAAGDIRGKISGASDYEASPSLAERNILYGNLNAVNPIVNFASKGLEIFVQKTY